MQRDETVVQGGAVTSLTIVLPDDYQEVFTDSEELSRLRSLGEVRHYTTPPADRAELLERLREANVILGIRERTPIDAELLSQLPNLRMISLTGTGYPHLDVAAATAHGVAIANTPGLSAQSVAELTIGLILAVLRRIPQRDQALRGGRWDQTPGRELAGRTLGILGLGDIGLLVAHLGHAFGMRVIAWGPTLTADRANRVGVRLASLEELLRSADVVSLHLRLSSRTRGVLGREEIGLMKRTAILINTARAELTDETALFEALRAGHIAGAGLDVYATEPLPPMSPLLGLSNVVLTPHIGWVTNETGRRFAHGAVENIANWRRGEPTHVVNPEALARNTW